MSSGDRDDPDNRNDPAQQDHPAGIAAVRSRVQTPAIVMLVFAILSLVLMPLAVKSYFTLPAQVEAEQKKIDDNPDMPAAQKKEVKDILKTLEKISLDISPYMIILDTIVGIISIIGSLKMKNLTSRGWAMTAAVLNIISIDHGCCCFALPVGVWALVVLLNPDVSAGFAAVARDRSQAREQDRDRDSDSARYE
jgi:predicted PurR-regulated permease PerM